VKIANGGATGYAQQDTFVTARHSQVAINSSFFTKISGWP